MAILDDHGSSGSNDSGPTVERPRPLLHDGQKLDQPTFHELYRRMPEDFRAELIDGVVYVNTPLYEDHAIPGASLTGVLYYYRAETPGTILLSNPSTRLGPKSEVQPDCALKIDPAHGGRSHRDEKGLTLGVPEMVVEVSFSSLQVDLKVKKRVYEEAGALEYVVFDVPNHRFHWFVRGDRGFEPLLVNDQGVYCSRAFPGLWLDEAAFLRDDNRAVLATLRRGLDSPEHEAFVDRLRQYRANRP